MKSFISSLVVFLLMLTGVIYYQNIVEIKIDEINNIINDAENFILNYEKLPENKQIEQLKTTFSDMKEWIMIFENHDKIYSMEQCMESMMTYCNSSDTSDFLSELKNLKYLINNFSDSVKPTIKNIF